MRTANAATRPAAAPPILVALDLLAAGKDVGKAVRPPAAALAAPEDVALVEELLTAAEPLTAAETAAAEAPDP